MTMPHFITTLSLLYFLAIQQQIVLGMTASTPTRYHADKRRRSDLLSSIWASPRTKSSSFSVVRRELQSSNDFCREEGSIRAAGVVRDFIDGDYQPNCTCTEINNSDTFEDFDPNGGFGVDELNQLISNLIIDIDYSCDNTCETCFFTGDCALIDVTDDLLFEGVDASYSLLDLIALAASGAQATDFLTGEQSIEICTAWTVGHTGTVCFKDTIGIEAISGTDLPTRPCDLNYNGVDCLECSFTSEGCIIADCSNHGEPIVNTCTYEGVLGIFQILPYYTRAETSGFDVGRCGVTSAPVTAPTNPPVLVPTTPAPTDAPVTEAPTISAMPTMSAMPTFVIVTEAPTKSAMPTFSDSPAPVTPLPVPTVAQAPATPRPMAPVQQVIPATPVVVPVAVPTEIPIPNPPQMVPAATPTEPVTVPTAPVDNPMESPVVNPIESPVDNPIESPVDNPIESPVDNPIESPIDNPNESPVVNPIESPVDNPIESPVDNPIESPVDIPIESPVDNPIESPVDNPIRSPVQPLPLPTFTPVGLPSSFPSGSPSAFPSGSPSTPSKPTSLPIDCVSSDFELRTRIAFASENSTFPTRIVLCSDIDVSQEITITEKAFDLYCMASDDFCQLNAQNGNRIFFGAPKQVSFNKIDFVNGKAEDENGGAIFLEGEGTVWFQGSRFFNNRAQRGGVMYINGPLQLAVTDCLFQLNQATVNAGVIYIDAGSIFFEDSVFQQNTAFTNGGVVYMKDGDLTIENTIFSENVAVKSGGALFFDSVGNVLIDASSFLENNSNSADLPAGGGGAIASFLGDITIRNTVFSGNTGSNGFDILIEDDSDSVARFGSFVNCAEQVVFCNGLNGTEELLFLDANQFVNSNCPELGVAGSPGDGLCPL